MDFSFDSMNVFLNEKMFVPKKKKQRINSSTRLVYNLHGSEGR